MRALASWCGTGFSGGAIVGDIFVQGACDHVSSGCGVGGGSGGVPLPLANLASRGGGVAEHYPGRGISPLGIYAVGLPGVCDRDLGFARATEIVMYNEGEVA